MTADLLSEFGMDFNALYQRSLENPENQRAIQMDPFETEPDRRNIFIMTTESFYWGESAMLYKDKVHELADKLGGDLILFPNSINQCLALPKEIGKGKNGFRKPSMIVRKTVISREIRIYPILFILIARKWMKSKRRVKG